jgi:hypothetical protein
MAHESNTAKADMMLDNQEKSCLHGLGLCGCGPLDPVRDVVPAFEAKCQDLQVFARFGEGCAGII